MRWYVRLISMSCWYFRIPTRSCWTCLDNAWRRAAIITIWWWEVTVRIRVFPRERQAESQSDEITGDIDQHHKRIIDIIYIRFPLWSMNISIKYLHKRLLSVTVCKMHIKFRRKIAYNLCHIMYIVKYT